MQIAIRKITLASVTAFWMIAGIAATSGLAQTVKPSPSPLAAPTTLEANSPSSQPPPQDQLVEALQRNPWVLILAGGLLSYLGILWIKPLWLLKLPFNDLPLTLPSFGMSLPVDSWLKYNNRVLDAWVEEYYQVAQDEFFRLTTVAARKIYIPLPVLLDGTNIDGLSGRNLTSTFGKRPAVLLITGEGGTGKTSLACQIAQWGLEKQLSPHRMLPVLLETELDEKKSLLEAIRGQLNALTSQPKPIESELLNRLLQSQRILVIVDHLSEMSEATRKQVTPDLAYFPAKALVVTSRWNESLGGVRKTVIKPLQVEPNRLWLFMSDYLKAKGKQDLFEDDEFAYSYRLRRITAAQSIPALLACLYIDRIIRDREGAGGILPDSVPQLMLGYLNHLNRSIEAPNKRDDLAVQRDAKAIAWACVKHTYRPSWIKKETAIAALAQTDSATAQARLEYLEKRLQFLKTSDYSDLTEVFLDPLAEYLAAAYLVDHHSQQADPTAAWQQFFADIDQKLDNANETSEFISGFLWALRDCCLENRSESKIPEFVPDELARRAGLDPEELRLALEKRRIRLLINELSAPELEYRLRAAQDLGEYGSKARIAIPNLIGMLENKNNSPKVRQAAAKTLGQIAARETVPTLIEALKDKYDDIEVRKKAAKALGDIGDEIAVPDLTEALKNDLIHDIAKAALWRISSTLEQQFQEQYPSWAKQIRNDLYKSNCASLLGLPEVQRDTIKQKFCQELDYLNLTFHQDSFTIEVSERNRLNEFRETWQLSKKAMEQNEIEKFRIETDNLTQLLIGALGFRLLDSSVTQGQFCGRTIDASNPAFELNIHSKLLVIYACKKEFDAKDEIQVRSLLHCFKIPNNGITLLIIFPNSQQIPQQIREFSRRIKCIVISYEYFWDILTAKSPIQQLTNCILEQIDLVAVSPYQVYGFVGEKMFFGRVEEENTLLHNIETRNYALLANRKCGKTSLLRRISSHLQSISIFQVFYCDLQNVNTYNDFYQKLSSFPEFRGEISKITHPSPLDFEGAINGVNKHFSDQQTILIFDEVDELLAYDIENKEQLFKTFRSVSQSRNIRFIFSGTTVIVKRILHPDSPFFNFCDVIKLEFLQEKAAKELVTRPMKSIGISFENETEIVKRIISITARHPNLIQYTCNELVRIINNRQKRIIEIKDLDIVIQSQEFYEYFEKLIWGQSTSLEKLIIYTMWTYSEFSESEVFEEFNQRGISTEGVKTSLEILLTYSILTKRNNKYDFTFHEFARLVQARNEIPELAMFYQQEIRRT
jgi:hypothetical protein